MTVIGSIRFDWAGEPCIAELSDDLLWSCDHPSFGADVARWLQTLFDPTDDLTPSRGMPGAAALEAAAEWLGAAPGPSPSTPEGGHLHVF